MHDYGGNWPAGEGGGGLLHEGTGPLGCWRATLERERSSQCPARCVRENAFSVNLVA
jgi:hypothetical protein